ncbi:MAG: hypothetical protein M3Z50_00450 [Actinomycetota bacterium]|nr:hypothetical protein [Actinomycetota bacterium]
MDGAPRRGHDRTCGGQSAHRYKTVKRFDVDIADDLFTDTPRTQAICREAALDGVYVIRIIVAGETLDIAGAVETLKSGRVGAGLPFH